MSEPGPAPSFKPKKSVALSAVIAGNTALSTVGRSGNDLHYLGYDILDLAEQCEFEEVAFLLIYGHLPNLDELNAYKAKLQSLRGLPPAVRTILEALPKSTHPMDVLRTGVSALGCVEPEADCSRVWVQCFCTGNISPRRVCELRLRPMTNRSVVTFCICCTARRRHRHGSRRCICRLSYMPNMNLMHRRSPRA